MHKVVTINLNGQAYQLDEPAYDALRAYLDRAETQLRENPDRAEILADLEQAIGEKCQRYLSPHKNVVGGDEMAEVLKEMGPVEGGAGDSAGAGPAGGASASDKPRTETATPKRLYRIAEGAMVGGVCNGIAAFLGVDVTVVRIVAALIAVIELATSHFGFVVLLYFVLMFVIPEAATSEERAAAHGAPFNAQEVVDRAMRNISAFKDHDWRRQNREWRKQHREWKRNLRRTIRAQPWWGPWGAVPPATGYASRIAIGLMIPALAIASLVLLWFFVYAMISLLSSGSIYTWPVPGNVPLWAAILAVVVIYNAIAWPIHAARRASYYALGGPYYGWYAAGDGLMSVALAVLMLWLGYRYVPEFREFIERLPMIWDQIRTSTF